MSKGEMEDRKQYGDVTMTIGRSAGEEDIQGGVR